MTASSADSLAGFLALGVLGRPHGVRGELVFHPHNPTGVRLEVLRYPIAATLGDHTRGPESKTTAVPKPVCLLGARAFGDKSLIRIEGLVAPEAAAPFTNRELLLPRSVLPPLTPGQHYVADLIGCAVVDAAGVSRGAVASAFWNGHHDVLTVLAPDGGETLIPAVPDFLIEVDLVARRLVIDDHE